MGEADVLPHPHVVDLEEIALARVRRSRRSTQEFRVGLYLQAKLANQDPAAVLPGLLRVIDELPGAVLQVDCDHELLDPGPREDPDLATALRRLADHGRIDLRTREPFTVRELVAYLDTIDLSVLPYRFGTHSAWLEACRDVGVTVLAPSCGYFHEQGPVLTYPLDEHRMDADSLQAAVRQAWEHRPHLGATVDERRVQRRRIEEHHSSLTVGWSDDDRVLRPPSWERAPPPGARGLPRIRPAGHRPLVARAARGVARSVGASGPRRRGGHQRRSHRAGTRALGPPVATRACGPGWPRSPRGSRTSSTLPAGRRRVRRGEPAGALARRSGGLRGRARTPRGRRAPARLRRR